MRGRYFKELDKKLQNRILHYGIHTVTFTKDCDPSLKFIIFKRLNESSTPLNDQEIRNCVFRGPYMNLLIELSNMPEFKSIVNESEKRILRMFLVEYVLRFASFHHSKYNTNSLRRFIDNDVMRYQNISDFDAKELKQAFKNGLEINKLLFGPNAFRKLSRSRTGQNSEWTPKFSIVLFELAMATLCRYDKHVIHQNMDAIREAWYDLLLNPEFIEVTKSHTTHVDNVHARFLLWEGRLREILKHSSEPRCFSFEFKRSLYNENPTCSICGNHIVSIDDAAVDHIEQYWLGGKTIPENARLTHRFCNNSRKRIEL